MAMKRSSPMEEELFSIWNRKIDDLPVYKDLPRLAGRTTVLGQFSKPPIKAHPLQAVTTVRDFLKEKASVLHEDVSVLEEYARKLENDFFIKLDLKLFTILPEKWQEYGIPQNIVDEILKGVTEEREALKKKEEEEEEDKEKEKRHVERFSLSFDPEQVNEVQIVEVLQKPKEDHIRDEPDPTDTHSKNRSILEEVRIVVTEVAQRIETKEQQEQIEMAFQELLAKENYSTLELEMEKLFEKTIGKDSKTARIFKAIHQNIIFAGMFHLKSKVPMTTMTRDVREKHGWRVYITFFNNCISVIHKRREQSLEMAPPDERYWFEWELGMIFDKDLTDMQSSVLKITDLGFSDSIKLSKRLELSRALSCGNLIVT